jgi:hypothetical protein
MASTAWNRRERPARASARRALRFHGLWRLMEPIVGAEIRANEVKELEKLKGLVEAAG